MEQLGADIMIGPLSGDESIAVANYAKQHPDEDVRRRLRGRAGHDAEGAGAELLPLQRRRRAVERRPRRPRVQQAGWKTAAVVADDYSFAWTSAAGFIAEFCAVGGNVTKRVFPPLNTTDYSSYAQQMPTNVDGTFVAVGGAGLIPFLKAYEQAHGPIDGKKFIGNLFWGTPGQFEQLGTRVSGAYVGGAGTAGDLATKAAQGLQRAGRQGVQDDPAVRRSRAAGIVDVHVRLLRQHVGPDQRPARPSAATSPAARRSCRRRSRKVTLAHAVRPDQARQEPPGGHQRLLRAALHEGRQARDRRRSARSRASTRRSAARSPARRRLRDATSRSASSGACRGSARRFTRRSPASRRRDASSTSRRRRADPPLAGDRPAVRRPPRRARRRSRRRARRAARHPRAERRRQDDAVQRHLGRRPAEHRHDRVPRRGHQRAAARARARSSAWAARTRSPVCSSASRSRTTSTSRCSASRAATCGRSCCRRRDGELRERARELAALVGLARHASRRSSARSRTASSASSRSAMARASNPTPDDARRAGSGLSRGERVALTELLLSLDPSITLILIEHDMDVALRVAERVTMMHDGRVIVEGTPDEIRANQTVHDLYLGRGYQPMSELVSAAARDRERERLLRHGAGARGRLVRDRRRLDVDRRPQRDGQDDALQRDHGGPARARHRLDPLPGHGARRHGRRTRSPSSGSATSRRAGGCSRRCRSTSTCA